MLQKLFLFLGLLLILAGVALVAGAGIVLATDAAPKYLQVNADESFVFAHNGRPTLATPYGPYYLTGERFTSGCYKLMAPVVGEEYGEAVYVQPVCKIANSH